MIYLLSILVAAYLGARMADSPVGMLGELHTLAALPGFLWDALRGKLPTEADVERERAKLEAMIIARRAE